MRKISINVLTPLAFLLFVTMLSQFSSGSVTNKGNKNSHIESDRGSTGFVENCSNSFIKLRNSHVSATSNSNTNIELDGCGKVEINGNTNSKIEGNNNSGIVYGSNSNCMFSGNNWSNCRFTNNRNTDVTGDNHKITAEDNSNVKISGRDNNLSVVRAFNLHIRREAGNSANKFQVEIGPRYNKKSWLSSIFGSGDLCKTPDTQYLAEYLNQAAVDGDRYQLGAFQFHLTHERQEVVIQLDDQVVVQPAGSNSVVVTGNGEKLVISGPQITEGRRAGELRIPTCGNSSL